MIELLEYLGWVAGSKIGLIKIKAGMWLSRFRSKKYSLQIEAALSQHPSALGYIMFTLPVNML